MSFSIDPRLPLTAEVQRIGGEEIEKVVAFLDSARDSPEKGLHNARKRIKALRSLLRLVRPGDEAFCRAENDRFREMSKSIAGPRQATALIETIDRLIADFPEDADNAGLAGIRAMLARHRASIAYGEAGLGATLDAAVTECRAAVDALDTLSLPDNPDDAADILAEGALTTLRRARKGLELSRERGGAEDFHELRKAVKTHAAHLSLLRKLWPAPVRPRRERADLLGESLGELHDVLVMRALIEMRETPFDGAEPKHLVRLLKRSEKALRKLCIAGAEELFEDKSKRGARKLARTFRNDRAEDRATPDPETTGEQ
ncbi:CHAD domain-containing protein [Aminobacter sp. HY435]|uniref:CHAD domain-containing protein n=1 Tax=Aminobacter sp. HY435 TaxID=2970917 RepID=UPI0022B9B783|nr:CHAD domain-containing protein [Aminobacter sp. HY435]